MEAVRTRACGGLTPITQSFAYGGGPPALLRYIER